MKNQLNQGSYVAKNTVVINTITGQVTKGELDLPRQTIVDSGTILANIFLDFMRNGGDMEKLSPKEVFAREKKEAI